MNPRPTISPLLWATACRLLCLDRMVPFRADMGLELDDGPAFTAALREVAASARARHAADRPLVPDLWRAVFESPWATAHPTDARRLAEWANRTFQIAFSDQPHATGWDIALREMNRRVDARETEALRGIDVPALLRDHALAMDTTDLEDRIADAKNAPLSDADLETYTIHGYDDESDTDDPFEIVLATAECHRIRLLLGDLCLRLDDDARRRLTEVAAQKLVRLGVVMPEPLREPCQVGAPC
jgi:hypothetical protein